MSGGLNEGEFCRRFAKSNVVTEMFDFFQEYNFQNGRKSQLCGIEKKFKSFVGPKWVIFIGEKDFQIELAEIFACMGI